MKLGILKANTQFTDFTDDILCSVYDQRDDNGHLHDEDGSHDIVNNDEDVSLDIDTYEHNEGVRGQRGNGA